MKDREVQNEEEGSERGIECGADDAGAEKRMRGERKRREKQMREKRIRMDEKGTEKEKQER